MKVNTITVSKLGTYNVYQRTSDGMFNATKLLKQWNERNKNKRELSKFWSQGNVKQYLMNIENNCFEKNKGSRGMNSGTWMRYDLFFYFTMWLSPYFHYYIIKMFIDNGGEISDTINDISYNYNTFTYVLKLMKYNNVYKIGKTNNISKRISDLEEIYGQLKLIYLIEKNIESDLHKKYNAKRFEFENAKELFCLNDDDLIDLGIIYHKSIVGENLYKSIHKLTDINFDQINKALNCIIFGKDNNTIRQNATQEQLRELTALQQQLAFTIKMGYVRTFEQLINEMRRIWDMKYNQLMR